MVAKLVWLTSVKHAAVNFPVSDYGAFTPLMPTKIYNDTRVPPGKFAVYNLPNGLISTVRSEALSLFCDDATLATKQNAQNIVKIKPHVHD